MNSELTASSADLAWGNAEFFERRGRKGYAEGAKDSEDIGVNSNPPLLFFCDFSLLSALSAFKYPPSEPSAFKNPLSEPSP